MSKGNRPQVIDEPKTDLVRDGATDAAADKLIEDLKDGRGKMPFSAGKPLTNADIEQLARDAESVKDGVKNPELVDAIVELGNADAKHVSDNKTLGFFLVCAMDWTLVHIQEFAAAMGEAKMIDINGLMLLLGGDVTNRKYLQAAIYTPDAWDLAHGLPYALQKPENQNDTLAGKRITRAMADFREWKQEIVAAADLKRNESLRVQSKSDNPAVAAEAQAALASVEATKIEEARRLALVVKAPSTTPAVIRAVFVQIGKDCKGDNDKVGGLVSTQYDFRRWLLNIGFDYDTVIAMTEEGKKSLTSKKKK